MAAIECNNPGGHLVDYCEKCDTCFCVFCELAWYRPPRDKILYPTFYWPDKGYVTTGGCMSMFDARDTTHNNVGCH